ncbi:2-oxo-4-hydroxy-4-carboxy-5-ureidoimidazoline decarboxylase [Acetobacter sp. AN02]|uniref:2-oxo-4-hydroxy-4-carboxy-5-ureidoimidazoline decarboxylase n=1 Tax=Acetobacter sp. AN02 TaxID=2894186 RepID=UPI00243441BA|nr:2-oxo-4-hydroxy-4-carboxy-5-ureidoimidazoline decarboxylase [Acetobacter sp. AN02]MDG6094772.1 2-oxo-4-hydroxy-4-carboxy-5-ureidoimidazoline decarboxylase [Acetobacter sp. AN02]
MTDTVLTRINTLDRAGFIVTFGALYEHSPWIAEAAWKKAHPFSSPDHVRETMRTVIAEATALQKMALIREHPELARRFGADPSLTDSSSSEQASAGLDRLTRDEYTEFRRLNDAYAAKFSIPFIICVRLSDKQHILSEMDRRLNNTEAEEQAAALAEIDKIADLRFKDVIKKLENGS